MSMVERTTVTVENVSGMADLLVIEKGSMFFLDEKLYVVVECAEPEDYKVTMMNLQTGELEKGESWERVIPVKSIIATPYTREEIKEQQNG